MGSVIDQKPTFTLEQLRRKRGRYEEVNGVICKWCTDHHSFLPVEAFDYISALGRHAALCHTHEEERVAYAATPEGQAETEHWHQATLRRKQRKLAEPERIAPSRKRSCHKIVDGQLLKTCTTCNQALALDHFRKHGNHLRSQCRACMSLRETAYRKRQTDIRKARRLALRDPITEERHRATANTLRLQKRRERESTPEAKEKRRIQAQRYRAKATITSRARHRKRLQTDIEYRLKVRLKSRLSSCFSARRARKTCKTITLLGCTVKQLRSHLESLWLPNMSWENYGAYKVGQPMTWHIDHIKPVASYNLLDPEQQKACFHWSNLQPLWAVDNIVKSDRLDWKADL